MLKLSNKSELKLRSLILHIGLDVHAALTQGCINPKLMPRVCTSVL